MLFKHDHDKKNEIQNIKNVVTKSDATSFEEEIPIAAGPVTYRQPSTSYQRSSEPIFESKPEQTAPLFVKIEKYREVISSIHEMKLFVASTKDIFTLLQDIENIRSDALNVMKVTVQRLEKAVAEMDSELLRPRGMNISPFPEGEAEVKHIESSLTDLQRQLLELKQELQGIR